MEEIKISAFELEKAMQAVNIEINGAAVEAMNEASEEVGKEALKMVKEDSPVRTDNVHRKKPPGSYKKGWKMTHDKAAAAKGINTTIYNATDYRLTHLLEFGHLTKTGKRTRPQPHISTANEYVHKTLPQEILKRINEKLGGET